MCVWRAVLAIAVAACGVAASACYGQAPEAEQGRHASATLPESNEALLLASRIEEATRAGDYHLAVQLIGRMAESSGALVAAPASRTFDPIWRTTTRLVAQLPREGLDVYRQLHDADVAARLRGALSRGDTAELVRLFRAYPLTTAWPQVGREAAARLIDLGEIDQAVEILRELLAAADGDSQEVRVQLAVAMAAAKARGAARRVVESMRPDPALLAQPAWRERLERLSRWIEQRSHEPGRPARPFAPTFSADAAWSLALTPDGVDVPDDDGLAEAVDARRRLPLVEPVIAGDVLLVRMRGMLWALDSLTLTPRWTAAEIRRDEPPALDLPDANDRTTDQKLSPEARLLLEHHLRHVVSVGFGRVYTIEGLSLRDEGSETFRGAFQFGGSDVFRRNEIVARSLATGREEWRTSQEAASALAHVAFQDRPLVLDGKLIVAFQRDDDLRLASIDPATGRLLREVGLIGPPTKFDSSGGRSLVVSDGETVYVSTGNGVVAAVSAADFSWRWATVYPSTTLAEHLGRLWWQPREAPVESGVDRPLIADDLLIVAPVDSSDIIALDRFNGRERWRIPRGEHAYLVGATDAGVIVGSSSLCCLDIDDPLGRPPLWRTVPLDVTGRPALRSGRVFIPTRRGVVVVDERTGKVVAGQAEARAARVSEATPAAAARPAVVRLGATNLLAASDGLFAVAPDRVIKFPDLDALRERAARLQDRDATDGRAELALAWAQACSGELEAALHRVEAMNSTDTALNASRDQVLTYIFLEMAGRSAAGADRLTWLRQAAERVTSAESAARLAAVIGDSLEAEGRWDEAIDHYATVLTRREPRLGVHPADGTLRVSDWLHAAMRVRSILRSSESGAFAARLIERARTAEDPVRALLRVRVALEDAPGRLGVDVELAQTKLSPELAEFCLPDADDPGLPEDVRRRIHLARWETHASLDDRDAARADAAYWKEHFANRPLPPGDAATREQEWVAQIQRIQDKLGQIQGRPFSRESALASPRWKLRRSDLVLDARRPLSGARPWILVRNLEHRRIQLIDSIKHQSFAWRQFDESAQSPQPLAFNLRVNFDDVRRATWPVVVYRHLAAVPSAGQLIAIGLAPQSRSPGPLWEHPVPLWTEAPRDFEQRAAAGPRGVYFAPRPDRVVLVGWFDGKVWWQRDFPGVVIQSIHLCDEDLVVVTEDKQVFVLDAALGGPLRRLPDVRPTPRLVDVARNRLIVWTSEAAQAFDRATLAPVWALPVRDVEKTIPVHGRNWFAFRPRDAQVWQVLDVAAGTMALPGVLAAGEYTAAAVDGERLLIAAQSGDPGDAESTMLTTTVTAYDVSDGRRLWSRTVLSSVPVNVTQLCGHPQYVPLLLNQPPGPRNAFPPGLPVAAGPYWALQLVDKQTGDATEPSAFRDKFDPVATECDAYLLVTPTRILVQAHGNVLAFGDPPESVAP